MSLREMPTAFVCDLCHEQHPVDALCTATMRRDWLACRRCCPCPTHPQDDPGGHAVFAAAPGGRLTWRGLSRT